MRRRLVLACFMAACAGPGLAQQAEAPRRTPPRPPPRQARPTPSRTPQPAATQPAGAPAGAPARPPPPPVAPPAAAPPPPPPIPLPAGMQNLSNGGWRVLLTQDATEIPPGFRATLGEIARRLTATSGRVTLVAQAPAPALEASFARRLSLERALSLKSVLVGGGLDPTRIDIRPMGRQAGGADQVDILPPGAPR